jgi:hypothetical protein
MDKPPSFPEIRAALAEAIERTSLRAVARNLDMSPSGLRKFLDGTEPYTPTMRRVREWYSRWAVTDAGRILIDRVDALVALAHPGRQGEGAEGPHRGDGVRPPLAPQRSSTSPRGHAGGAHQPARPGNSAGHTRCKACGEVVRWSEYAARAATHEA